MNSCLCRKAWLLTSVVRFVRYHHVYDSLLATVTDATPHTVICNPLPPPSPVTLHGIEY